MSKSREIVGQELRILEDLFDLALAVYGVKDKKFVNLTAKETRELQEAIVEYVVRHADPKSARYAKSEDARGYNTYREKLRNKLYKSYPDNGDKVLSDEDRVIPTREDKIGSSESMINSVVLYATKGKKKTWSLYRSSVKNSEIQDKGNSLEGDKPIPVVITLPNADFAKEDERDEWMIYELAFLWHEKEPPGIQAHFYAMTREIELTKSKLHQAVENGLLEARTEVLPDGITRFVTRQTLEKHIKERGLVRPEFLKRELRSK